MSILPGVSLNRGPQSSVPALKAISPLRTRYLRRADRDREDGGSKRNVRVSAPRSVPERTSASLASRVRQRASDRSALKLCVAANHPARTRTRTDADLDERKQNHSWRARRGSRSTPRRCDRGAHPGGDASRPGNAANGDRALAKREAAKANVVSSPGVAPSRRRSTSTTAHRHSRRRRD